MPILSTYWRDETWRDARAGYLADLTHDPGRAGSLSGWVQAALRDHIDRSPTRRRRLAAGLPSPAGPGAPRPYKIDDATRRDLDTTLAADTAAGRAVSQTEFVREAVLLAIHAATRRAGGQLPPAPDGRLPTVSTRRATHPSPDTSDPGPGPDPEAWRDWTRDELLTGLLLAFGPNLRGTGPDLHAAAAHLAVTPRSVQRWLAGNSRPTPTRAHTLRAAIAPAPDVLRREELEVAAAQAGAAHLDTDIDTDDPVVAMWRSRGWHYPHRLIIARHPDLAIERAAVIRDTPQRVTAALRIHPRPASGAWDITSQVRLPHRFAAILTRGSILTTVATYRVVARHALMPTGGSQIWLNTAPTVDPTRHAIRIGYPPG